MLNSAEMTVTQSKRTVGSRPLMMSPMQFVDSVVSPDIRFLVASLRRQSHYRCQHVVNSSLAVFGAFYSRRVCQALNKNAVSQKSFILCIFIIVIYVQYHDVAPLASQAHYAYSPHIDATSGSPWPMVSRVAVHGSLWLRPLSSSFSLLFVKHY